MGYRNFTAALYMPAGNIMQEGNLETFKAGFHNFETHVKLGKVYLETYRSDLYADPGLVREIKKFLESKGVRVSGGITTTEKTDRPGFGLLCYTSPANRKKLTFLVEETAKIFDEVILDDFYFTDCRCADCIRAKGERDWSAFRTELMAEVSKTCVMEPARKANPAVKVIIKFPNWYDHYHNQAVDLI